MTVICGRNSDEMFYLTRDGDVEVTCVGFIHREKSDLFHCVKGGLYWYAWQAICEQRGISDYTEEEFDEFGRNYTDRLFIRFCASVFDQVEWDDNNTNFKSLSCKKKGEQYIARLELTDETLEMELSEMVALLEQRFRTNYT